MGKHMARAACAALCVAAAGLPDRVDAAPRTFLGSDGVRTATAIFDATGTNLTIKLKNIGLDILQPDQVLTGVFFTLSGNPVLTPVSAIVPSGSSVLFGSTDPGGVVGGEWAYATGISGPIGTVSGISSSGLGIFGNANFPGSNLQGPAGVDGLQFGLASAADDPATGNAPVTGANALVRNEVVFTLSGLPSGFDPSAAGRITEIWFQYGTSLSEPGFSNPGEPPSDVPEPPALVLLGAALGLAALRRPRAATA